MVTANELESLNESFVFLGQYIQKKYAIKQEIKL